MEGGGRVRFWQLSLTLTNSHSYSHTDTYIYTHTNKTLTQRISIVATHLWGHAVRVVAAVVRHTAIRIKHALLLLLLLLRGQLALLVATAATAMAATALAAPVVALGR